MSSIARIGALCRSITQRYEDAIIKDPSVASKVETLLKALSYILPCDCMEAFLALYRDVGSLVNYVNRRPIRLCRHKQQILMRLTDFMSFDIMPCINTACIYSCITFLRASWQFSGSV